MCEQISLIKTAGALPEDVEYLFDERNRPDGLTGKLSDGEMLTCPTRVYKTRCRTVVTLKHGKFTAREVVRQKTRETGETERFLVASWLTWWLLGADTAMI